MFYFYRFNFFMSMVCLVLITNFIDSCSYFFPNDISMCFLDICSFVFLCFVQKFARNSRYFASGQTYLSNNCHHFCFPFIFQFLAIFPYLLKSQFSLKVDIAYNHSSS